MGRTLPSGHKASARRKFTPSSASYSYEVVVLGGKIQPNKSYVLARLSSNQLEGCPIFTVQYHIKEKLFLTRE
jgi:hypothetical protein